MTAIKSDYIPKEISWLSFNERVLQEADNRDVPLIERIKYLGIYSNNLDEYFRVRVATLKRLAGFAEEGTDILGYSPAEALREINKIVLRQRGYYEDIYKRLIKDLAKERIIFRNEDQLNETQAAFVNDYFHEKVKTVLMPFFLRKETKINSLKDDAIYFAITIVHAKETKKNRYAIMELPTNRFPRFIKLPSQDNEISYIFLDDIVRYGLKELFYMFKFRDITAHTIKVNKDAELDIVDDISDSYVEQVSRGLLLRKKGLPVRFLYDRDIPDELLRIITEKLRLVKQDALIPGGRYHNLKDFIKFPDPGVAKFRFEPISPIKHKDIDRGSSVLSKLRKQDILLFFPYHSFDNFIDLLREASFDPAVQEIKITLYRVGANSSVINALTNAVKNGKEVTVVIELQARFDEEANINWSNRLIEEGVKVVHGVPGLKVHAKLCLITRVKSNNVQRYACIGTGNFNEDTARIYSDLLLMTSDTKITNEVVKIFSFLEKNYKRQAFYHLVVSPFSARNKFIRLINNEIANAKKGKKAYIHLKLNNLVDTQVISLLYEAGAAGVEVKLNVRAMFSLRPGVKGLSENIKAIGVVDRYLEHSRIMIFHNEGDDLCFISSGDFMARNFDRRVEVTCPVLDPLLQEDIRTFFDLMWNDNIKARILDKDLKNNMVELALPEIRSQAEIHKYLKSKSDISI